MTANGSTKPAAWLTMLLLLAGCGEKADEKQSAGGGPAFRPSSGGGGGGAVGVVSGDTAVAGGASVSLRPADTEIVRNTVRLGQNPPFFHMSALLSRGPLTLESDVPLPGEYELEFIPLLDARAAPGVKVSLTAIDAGIESDLGSFEPFPLSRAGGKADALPTLRARVDLSSFAGKQVQLRWAADANGSSSSVLLGDLILRPKQPDPALPPILMVCADSLRHDMSVGAEGGPLMTGLSEFKKTAVTYNRAFSTSNWTLPAITSALTGRFPRYHRTGLRVGMGKVEELRLKEPLPGRLVVPWQQIYLEFTGYPAGLQTIPELLQGRGYGTAMVTGNPYYSMSGLATDGHGVVIEGPAAPGRFLLAQVESLLGTVAADQPLFLMVHLNDAHDFEQYELMRRHPGQTLQNGMHQAIRESYGWAARAVDMHFTALLEMWDKRFGLDRSLVIFYSDHGEHLHDPGHVHADEVIGQMDPNLPADYRKLCVPVVRHGNSMQESLLRIPMLVRYPKALDLAGKESDVSVSLVDLMPTVLELAGVDPTALASPHQGQSLLPIARGEFTDERLLYADHHQHGDQYAAVRRGELKLVFSGVDGTSQLFRIDLEARAEGDPGGQLQDPVQRRKLMAALEKHVLDSVGATSGLVPEFAAGKDSVLNQLEELRKVR